MTLIEMLVAMVLLLWLSTVAFSMLLSGSAFYDSTLRRSSLRQEMQVIAWRLAQDAREGGGGLATVLASPPAVAFLSARDGQRRFATDASGAPVWLEAIVYYVPAGTTRLLRKVLPGPFEDAPDEALISAACDGGGTLLSASVTSFVVGVEDGTSLLTAGLTLTQAGGDDMTQAVRVWMRN